MKTQGHRILVADDNPADRALLRERLEIAGFDVDTASDGQEAWERLTTGSERYCVVLLDRRMPRIDGLELLEKLKEHDDLQHVPAIFQTGAGNRQDIREGIEAGCYYYLVKPYDAEILISIVKAAVTDFERYESYRSEARKGTQGLASMQIADFEFKTLPEAAALGTLLAYACPDPETQVVGLSELLINAVEHGNLEITYDDKTRLNTDGTWENEVERRLSLPEFRDRSVRVHFERTEGEIRITIRDEGKGFDWKPYLEIDPRRAFDTHGRGIAMAKMFSLSRLEFQGTGSELVAVVDS